MKNKYYLATISFDVIIEADNMETAKYLAERSIPKHLDYSTNGREGCGFAKFSKGNIQSISIYEKML